MKNPLKFKHFQTLTRMTRPYLSTFASIQRYASTPDEFLRMFEDALYSQDECERYWHWIYFFENDSPQMDIILWTLFSYKSHHNFSEILQKFVDICKNYIAKTPTEIPTNIPLVIDLSSLDGPDGDVNLTRARDPENPRHLMIETIDCLLELCDSKGEYYTDVLTHVYKPLAGI